MMERDTLCLMPGFMRAGAVSAITAEVNTIEAAAHRIDYSSTPYGWMNNAGYPTTHPRGALLRRNCGVLTTDQFSSAGPCHELFHVDELTECIRRMLQYETLYRSTCPTLSLVVNVMRESDRFGWHFDTNDGVVSFLIQNADDGGDFEYAPLVRDEDEENHPGVARMLAEQQLPSRPAMPAGTFTLFLGRRSLHRVSPVGATTRPRLSLLCSYDHNRDMRFPKASCDRILNPSPEPYLGALTSQ